MCVHKLNDERCICPIIPLLHSPRTGSNADAMKLVQLSLQGICTLPVPLHLTFEKLDAIEGTTHALVGGLCLFC